MVPDEMLCTNYYKLIHMETLQTKLLLGHLRNGDETGQLLLADLEYTQIISGLEHSILHKKNIY